MKIAVGLKAHSGWAALVALGKRDDEVVVIDRRRIELVQPDSATWAKQPYHAAEDLKPHEARQVVKDGIKAAHRSAGREMRELVKRSNKAAHQIVGCGVLVPAPMPDWTIDQILSVHMRMHKAEGVLFPSALTQAAAAANLDVISIPEQELSVRGEKTFGVPLAALMKTIVALGKSVGPPWGKDQKLAALAAMIILKEH